MRSFASHGQGPRMSVGWQSSWSIPASIDILAASSRSAATEKPVRRHRKLRQNDKGTVHLTTGEQINMGCPGAMSADGPPQLVTPGRRADGAARHRKNPKP